MNKSHLKIINNYINFFYNKFFFFNIDKNDIKGEAFLIYSSLLSKFEINDKFDKKLKYYLYKNLSKVLKRKYMKIYLNEIKNKNIYEVLFYNPTNDFNFNIDLKNLSLSAQKIINLLLIENLKLNRYNIKKIKNISINNFKINSNHFRQVIKEIKQFYKEYYDDTKRNI